MKHEDEPVNDYKKRMKEYITDLIKQEVIALGETKKKDSRGTVRDYKKEYAKYGSSKKAKKYRAELNQYNRKKGTYGNGDGKDASHKGGKIVGFESQSKNRGRAEKSRLKKEDIKEKSIPHTNPSYRMEKTMQKLAKSLGIKSVVSMYTGKGSLSYFLDDDREAKKLQKFLQRSFKRVRLITLDKSKGDTANWVVAADMIGFESVNERTRMKPQVKKLLKQKGYGPIFGAIDSSKQQLKQMRYSQGEIRDTLISMFGDEDPKILQRIKESINEKKGDFLDSLFPKSKVDKAVKIAHDMGGNMTGAVKKIERYFKGMTLHSKVRDALQQANESVNENNMGDELWEACWKGYEKKGMKKMFGKMYPNCVKKESYDIFSEDGGWGYTMDGIVEAEYQGRKVKLGKPMQGDVKKFKVYVKNPKGNVVKVNFGQGGDAKGGTMKIRKSNPGARKSFRARHNCDSPGPRHKARYWSCRKW